MNKNILEVLSRAKHVLDKEAWTHISNFVLKEMIEGAAFSDRAGKLDPYYSVFGYTLCYIFEIKVDTRKASKLFDQWEQENNLDFVHSISLLRCRFLLEAFKLKQKAGLLSSFLQASKTLLDAAQKDIAKKTIRRFNSLLKEIDAYKVEAKGYNHLVKSSLHATVYANFLVFGLFQDLCLTDKLEKLKNGIRSMRQNDGSFTNQLESKGGVSSATAAAILMSDNNNNNNERKSIDWLKQQITNSGGFLATPEAPIADVLSTGTSILALKLLKEASNKELYAAAEFVNLHWHTSGGFFGSIADQIPDVEYTFYALLAIGAMK